MVRLCFYKEVDGAVPMHESLEAMSMRARTKCVAVLSLLREHGHTLRRPVADFLRDGVYELRFREGRTNHRVLYGFSGKDVVVVSHAIVKERVVPKKEIDLAAHRLERFAKQPLLHGLQNYHE